LLGFGVSVDLKTSLDYLNPVSANVDLQTEEVIVARVMNQVGPFIAIGKPGEELPDLGAARTYVGSANWQDKVNELVPRAQLVVFRFGGEWLVKNSFSYEPVPSKASGRNSKELRSY